MSKTVEELLAKSAIEDIQKRYCRSVDRLDFVMLAGCFHPDADIEVGAYRGGPDGFVEMATAAMATYASTMHFIGNQLVELEPSGEAAWAERYLVAYHRCPAEGGAPEHDFICNFRYIDRVERRGGEWRIARRVMLVDSWRRVPLPDLGSPPTIRPGERGRGDLSYSDYFRSREPGS